VTRGENNFNGSDNIYKTKTSFKTTRKGGIGYQFDCQNMLINIDTNKVPIFNERYTFSTCESQLSCSQHKQSHEPKNMKKPIIATFQGQQGE